MPPSITVEDLPADLLELVVELLACPHAFDPVPAVDWHAPWDAHVVSLATASDALIAKIAGTLAPWDRGGAFRERRWHLHDERELALLVARNAFVAAASQVDERRWELHVTCAALAIDEDIEAIATGPAALTELTSLGIPEHAAISARSMGALAGLAHLTELELDGASVERSAADADLLQITTLKKLSLNNMWHLDDVVLASLCRLRDLTWLDCSGVRAVTDLLARSIAQLENLTVLNADSCEALSNAGVAIIARGCQNLSSVYLSRCHLITDDAVAGLVAMLPRLTRVGLNSCRKVTDASTKLLSQLENLEALDISNCDGLGPQSVEHVAKMHNLTELSATGVSLGSLEEIGTLPKLRKLECGHHDGADLGVASLANRAGLKKLDLCGRIGSLHSISEFVNLQWLQVRDSGSITDEALTSLAVLPHLQVVVLTFVPLLRTIALQECKALTTLAIGKCDQFETLLIDQCSALKFLHVDDCRELAKAVVTRCAALRIAHFTDCASNFGTVVIRECRAVQLAISGSTYSNPQLEDRMLSEMRIPTLESLELEGCAALDAPNFSGFPNLHRLKVSRCDVNSAFVFSISQLSSLRSLSLPQTRISDAAVEPLAAALPHLTELDLSDSEELSNASVKAIATRMLHLRSLRLNGMANIDDDGMSTITNLHRLVSLHLAACDISDAAMVHISSLPELTDLVLFGCAKVTDASLPLLSKLPKLRFLLVAGCSIESFEDYPHLALVAGRYMT